MRLFTSSFHLRDKIVKDSTFTSSVAQVAGAEQSPLSEIWVKVDPEEMGAWSRVRIHPLVEMIRDVIRGVGRTRIFKVQEFDVSIMSE